MDFFGLLGVLITGISSIVSAQSPIIDSGAPPPGWSNNGHHGSPPGWTHGNPGMPPPPSAQDQPWTDPRSQRGPGPNRPRLNHHEIYIPKIQYHHQPEYDYANALAKSMLFYEAQRSGELPYDHRVPWRGNSAMADGEDNGVDLSGGYYDSAGYIKYGFPMAYTTTVLSWGVIRYRRTYEAIGQLDHVLKTIKWATDYFLKCKTGPTEFWGQVSDQESDTRYTGPPESMNYKRKSYKLSEDMPGSDLVAETAAALAAASIVFYETDLAYSEVLISHAKELYDFAGVYKGTYHDSIKSAGKAYRSHSGYKDELAWAAAWIYRRTGDSVFMREVKRIYRNAKLQTQAILFSWDDKRVGVQMLLAEITGKETYKSSVRQFCEWCLPGGRSTYTPGGLLFIADWGPLRYAANAAFICSLAAEVNLSPSEYRLFALNQINYILGSTGRSYVVGFGVNPPTKYFHRSSYCPKPPAACPAFSANFDNVHVLYGALIGGPSETDLFYNSIEKREQSSVALDYNAGFQSALAAVLDIHIYGQQDRPKIDKPGKITTKNDTEILINDVEETGSTQEKKIVYDYGDALRKSILFYESQRSGVLAADNRIPWRFDSGLYDGLAINRTLVGGYYDGGDYVKYTFPLAFTLTTLSWGTIKYSDAYDNARQLLYVLDSIKWGADFLMQCQLTESDLVGQVGSPSLESLSWDRPKYLNQTTPRPVYIINRDKPGSDVAAEVAAAFASTALAFQKHIDGKYRENLIERAKLLFNFASNYTGVYTRNIFSAIMSYNSTGYTDELAWAAMWIYKATNDTKYLNQAKTIYTHNLLTTPKTFSYDDKRAGLHMLMAEETKDPSEIAKFCNWVVKSAKKTPKGLFYEYKPATKHAGNVAFILLMAAERFPSHPDASSWKWFARDQIHYILGSTGQSFVVGYGRKFPQQPYHKASSCPLIPLPCGFSYSKSSTPNPQLLVGAVVAGPGKNDTYDDVRMQKKETAVSLDTNAGFQSATAGLLHLQMRGLLNSAPRLLPPLQTLMLPVFAVVFFIKHMGALFGV